MTDPQVQQLLTTLAERGTKRVKVGGFDIDGLLRGKYISLDKLRSALDGGFGFCDVIFGWDIVDKLYDKSSITGWHRGFPDVQAVLDPDTLRFVPWEEGTAAILADFRDDEGGDYDGCPRSLLRRVLARAKSQGFDVKLSCEYEFFLFRETPRTLHEKGFRDMETVDPGMFGYSWLRSGQARELMTDIFDTMSAFDIELEGLHTETGPGVYEAAIRYDDALRAADKAALFKVALKQIAHEHGLTVTFMAKWSADFPGSSGHLHQSLWQNGKNAFHSPGGEMSTILRHFVGGQVLLMPELTALISPNVNSYKRYVPGVWAPLTATWGMENRTTALRLIGLDSAKAARVEQRQTAADLNPYIAMAACLAAGLHGIEQGIEPPEETKGDATEQGEPLPRSLTEAVGRLQRSEIAPALLGEGFVKHYLHTRQWELSEFNRAVTDWELHRYFEAL